MTQTITHFDDLDLELAESTLGTNTLPSFCCAIRSVPAGEEPRPHHMVAFSAFQYCLVAHLERLTCVMRSSQLGMHFVVPAWMSEAPRTQWKRWMQYWPWYSSRCFETVVRRLLKQHSPSCRAWLGYFMGTMMLENVDVNTTLCAFSHSRTDTRCRGTAAPPPCLSLCNEKFSQRLNRKGDLQISWDTPIYSCHSYCLMRVICQLRYRLRHWPDWQTNCRKNTLFCCVVWNGHSDSTLVSTREWSPRGDIYAPRIATRGPEHSSVSLLMLQPTHGTAEEAVGVCRSISL